jgi:hypothetical protein
MICFLTLFGPCSKCFVLGWLGGFDGNFLWNRIGAGKDFNSPYESTYERIETGCPSPTQHLTFYYAEPGYSWVFMFKGPSG